MHEDGVYDYLSNHRKNYILLGWDITRIKLKRPGTPPFNPLVNIKVRCDR